MTKHNVTAIKFTILALGLLIVSSCEPPASDNAFLVVEPPDEESLELPFHTTNRSTLYDQVLGSLVGSAIGDALGAPTEMWERENMQIEYGYIDSLYDMIREPSPEGTWDYNLIAGSTTDDTRWKILTGEYVLSQKESMYRTTGPDPKHFGQYILEVYEQEINHLKQLDGLDPQPFENQMRRLSWLQEWAQVAKPWVDDNLKGYVEAVNRFYGGEMACAGLLYSPIIGLVFPGAPEQAYNVSYDLSFFDLGYAKDLTAITAAMVANAFVSQKDPNQIVKVHQSTDPKHYFKSRLLGRIAYGLYRDALYKIHDIHNSGLSYEEQVMLMYEFLDARTQDVSFHAGEVHLINISAMMFCEFDFKKAIEFVINYGRDNDTVGAVTGSILGALHGYDQIPDDWKTTVLQTNKTRLGIDLEVLAKRITDYLVTYRAVAVLD